jgi:hypothetical protein
MPRRARVLHAHGLVQGGAAGQAQVHLGGAPPRSFAPGIPAPSPASVGQLFENQSVVEYWENFATHAFENTTQSVYSHCVLLKPDGTPVPATFCFHIRRDIFDLPSLVIGACPLPSLPPRHPWSVGAAPELTRFPPLSPAGIPPSHLFRPSSLALR